jgi:O-glycosyl hydrolase
LAAPTAHVVVDTTTQLQRLAGFGATVGYAEDQIATFSDPSALNLAMFAGLGLDVLRFRSRYGEVSDPALKQAADIVASAQQSLGRMPLVLLGSWSPPAALKQNGATFCADPGTCTLAKNASGGFDYAGLAAHWRNALGAYGRVGFVPDYVGIQNNPDWTPSGGAVMEACKFLPREGSANVFANGISVPVKYPGYDLALAAVTTALADLPSRPQVLVPELSSIVGAKEYLDALQPAQVNAVAHHMYGVDPTALDLDGLHALGQLGVDRGVPLFQTEMQADGFGTALLIHHALTEEGASMYLQTALVGPLAGPAVNPSALIGLTGEQLVLQDPYFAMSHFSRFTDPGWSRVATSTSTPGLLASAWLSPDHGALTIVLINAGSDALVVDLDLGAEHVRLVQLRRTVFAGSERFADLGARAAPSAITLPPRSIMTVAIEE